MKRIPAPYPVDNIFPAPLGNLLLRSEDKISLFDVSQKRVLSELTVSGIKFAVWSNESENPMLALWGKDSKDLKKKNK